MLVFRRYGAKRKTAIGAPALRAVIGPKPSSDFLVVLSVRQPSVLWKCAATLSAACRTVPAWS